jgi:hypothetical protein
MKLKELLHKPYTCGSCMGDISIKICGLIVLSININLLNWKSSLNELLILRIISEGINENKRIKV